MGECHLVALLAHLLHGCVEMSVGSSEAHDEQVGIVLVALHLHIGHLYVLHLLGTQVVHEVMVLRLRAYGSGVAVLLQTAKDMCVALLSRHSPVAHLCLGVALIGCVTALNVGCGISLTAK